MKSCMIFVDGKNQNAREYLHLIRKKLKSKNVQILRLPNQAELIIVLGGDGTMLKAVNRYWKLGKPFLGINFGYKGFMMNDKKDDVVEQIIEKRYKIYQLPLLEIETQDFKGIALNDIYFNRIGAKSCRINVKVNGVLVAKKIIGDGILVSTALGSTGYGLAAGGSAIYFELPVISLVPICVFVPVQIKPMVFPLQSEIEVKILSPKKETKAFHDGIELPAFQKVKIRGGNFWVKLAFWEEEDFTKRLIRKIMTIQGEGGVK